MRTYRTNRSLKDIAICRQKMPIMNVVWPLTALYWGPLGLIFYGWFGRAPREPPCHPPARAP